MKKQYKSAPLPFVGQKRMFAREFRKVMEQYQDGTTFVDLFGGSGLLSHIAKCQHPHSKVVYNDFDNYRQRLQNIRHTNMLLTDIREIVGTKVPRGKRIPADLKTQILNRIAQEQQQVGFVDYITISTSLLFSMKYALSFEELQKETLYNTIRKTDYPLCDDYLEGLDVISCDYKHLFEQYKDVSDVVFLVDPPYLSTDVGTYNMRWGLADYLDVLTVLNGHSFVYFTSNKSAILELCDWIGRNGTLGNPFACASKVEFNATTNYNSTYTDIMLYKKAR